MVFRITFLIALSLLALEAQDSRVSQADAANRRRDLQSSANAKPSVPSDEEEQAPEVIPGDRNDLGPQYLVKRKKITRWWDVKFDTQEIYTSNMLLQANNWHNRPVDATILVSTAEFDFAPEPIKIGENSLFPKIGFRHQWFNYALGDNGSMFRYAGNIPQDDKLGYNRFDFDSQTIFGNLNYVVDEHWVFGLGFDFTRLLTHEAIPQQSGNYSEFYKEYVPSWSATRIFQLTPITTAVVGYDGKLRYTDSENTNPRDYVDGTHLREINNRLDSAFSLSVRQQIVPTVFVQPFFRFQYSNYNINDRRNGVAFHDRQDFTYTTGASFSWDICDWFSISSFGSFEKRVSSSLRTDDYTKFDLGGGLSANFRF
jgi:hypothetical protein